MIGFLVFTGHRLRKIEFQGIFIVCDVPEKRIDSELQDALLDWFLEHRRELPWRTEDRRPYTIWVSEVMLQQTRVDTVIPYYEKFMERFPSVYDLAEADEEDVLNLWEGLGFYARARNMHESAQMIVQEHDGVVPDSVEELQNLPGIGPSTAAAIMSFAHQKQVPYLDGNVYRVISRFTGYTQNTETPEGKRYIRSVVDESMPPEQPGVFNESLIEFGAKVCTPSNPSCEACPLSPGCVAYRKGIQEELPYRGERREVPTRTRTGVFVTCGEEILLTRRPSEGLLGGMWEIPALWNEDDESLMQSACRTASWSTGSMQDVQQLDRTVTHKYSHFHLKMPLFKVQVNERVTGEDLWTSGWYKPQNLDEIPLHRAAQKALDVIEPEQ